MFCVHLALPLMNSFNKIEAAIFPFRFCFLCMGFPFSQLNVFSLYLTAFKYLRYAQLNARYTGLFPAQAEYQRQTDLPFFGGQCRAGKKRREFYKDITIRSPPIVNNQEFPYPMNTGRNSIKFRLLCP